jgi:aminopeptidase
VFREALLDENAACHIAGGAGIPSVLPSWRSLTGDQLRDAGVNQSATHVDFMIGGPGVTVTGPYADGTQTPILRVGTWQLPGGATRLPPHPRHASAQQNAIRPSRISPAAAGR